MKQIPASLLTLIAGVLVTLASLWVGQHHGLLPEQASSQAPLVDELFNTMVTIGFALFVIVEGALIFSAIRFRKRAGDEEDGEPIEGNVPLEIFWTLIPAVIVLGLSVYSVDVYQDMGGLGRNQRPQQLFAEDGSPVAQFVMVGDIADEAMGEGSELGPFGLGDEDVPAQLEVNVSGMQYAWIFEYPETDVVAGELHLPVGQDVQLNISAVDVIHSFWVPQFRLKQDAIPGQRTQLRFRPTQTGEYPVVCAELCGAYHGGMRATVVVEEQAEFDQWLTDNYYAQTHGDQTVAMASHPATLDPVEAHAHHLGMTAELAASVTGAQ